MYTVPEAVSLQPRPAAGRWFEAGREIEQNRTGLWRSLRGQEGTVDPWPEDRLAKKGIRCDTEQPRGANRSQWTPPTVSQPCQMVRNLRREAKGIC